MTPTQLGDSLTMTSSENAPSVSWLLCTHVANEQLQHAIKSCLSQSFSDFELVIVVNGATFEKVAAEVSAWAGQDSRVRIFTTPIRHLVFSLSLGMHYARAELVARMDADDISKDFRLERQVRFMNEHPHTVVLGSAYEIIDANGVKLKEVHPPTNNFDIRRALFSGNPLCHPSVIFRRKVVLDAGGYFGGLEAEDYDLWVRLSNDPINQFANLSEVCLSYRSAGVSSARRSRSAYASMAATQFRNFLNGQGLSWIFSVFLTIFKLLIRSGLNRRNSKK